MVTYKSPGTRARFIKTSVPKNVNNIASLNRVMAIIGTGSMYYDVINEPVTRSSDKLYDTLANSNVMSISSVTSKPITTKKINTTTTTVYENNLFELSNDRIYWTSDITDPKCELDTNSNLTGFVTANIKDNKEVVDGVFEIMALTNLLESEPDTFRVTNKSTGELIGDYFVQNKDYDNVIPGCTLKVWKDGCKGKFNENVNNTIINFGDTFTITTTAIKTENESSLNKIEDSIIPGENKKTEITEKYIVDEETGTERIVTDEEIETEGLTNVQTRTKTETKFVLDESYSNDIMKFIDNEILFANRVEDSYYRIEVIEGNEVKLYKYTGELTTGEHIDIADFTAIPNGQFPIGTNIENVISGIGIKVNKEITVGEEITEINKYIGKYIIVETKAREQEDAPLEGDVYYVSYKYQKDESEYNPKVFYSYNNQAVYEEYGDYTVLGTGTVHNSLTLGAEIAFESGLDKIVCVQVKNESVSEFKKAIDKLQNSIPGIDNISTIIPLTNDITVGKYLKEHVNLMSDEEYAMERMGYFTAEIGQAIDKEPATNDATVGIIQTAAELNDERIVFIANDKIYRTVSAANALSSTALSIAIPTYFAAIAIAALGITNDPAEPLTNKTISGFNGLVTEYKESEKNKMAGAGCLVLHQSGNIIKIRHGLTTYQDLSDYNSSEITCVQVKDYVIALSRKLTADGYIGRKNKPSMTGELQSAFSIMLNSLVSKEIILGVQNLQVVRDPYEPRQINISFQIEAIYPLNWIDIEFGFAAVS